MIQAFKFYNIDDVKSGIFWQKYISLTLKYQNYTKIKSHKLINGKKFEGPKNNQASSEGKNNLDAKFNHIKINQWRF